MSAFPSRYEDIDWENFDWQNPPPELLRHVVEVGPMPWDNPGPRQTGDVDSGSEGGLDFDHIDFNDPAHLAMFAPPGAPVPKTLPPDQVQEVGQEVQATTAQGAPRMLARHGCQAASHRPDFEAFRKESVDQRYTGTGYRDYFMWPYVNLEDLSKPKNMLLFLNARARHHPSDFAAADKAATNLGLVTRAITPLFLNEHTMIMNGVTNPEDYGKLVTWDDHPDAFEWMASRKQCLPGEGLLILEVQERVLKFLLDFCKAVLQDISRAKMTSDESYPVRPEPYMKTELETNGFESLAVMAAEAPYRPPARIDFARIELLLEAKVSAAKDHIWALREDPDYFSGEVADVRGHRQEILKDTRGHVHPALRPGRESLFTARVVGSLMYEAYSDLEIYTELHRQAKELRLLHQKYADNILPGKDLPSDFLDRLLTFRYYLDKAAKGTSRALGRQTPSSPPMRKFFVREPPSDPNSSRILIVGRPAVSKTKLEGQLLWLLGVLWEDGQRLVFAGRSLVLDELQRLLEAEPKAADLISSRVAGTISDATIISQCQRQLDQFQPWAMGYDFAFVPKEEAISKSFESWNKSVSSLVQASKDQNFVGMARLADTSNRRFFYPIDKRKTKENVEALRRAESHLDSFWQALDKVVDAHCDHLRGTAVRALLSEPRALQRTPEWVDEVPSVAAPAATGKRQPEKNTNDGVEMLLEPLSTLYFESQKTTAVTDHRAKPSPPPAKTKTKTKGQAKEASVGPPAAGPGPPSTEPSPKIKVDPRSLKVFRTLFFNPGVTSSPGEIPWQDFVHAMTSTGLFSAEKLYGSAWQFQKLDSESHTRIQFHQPHPRGKIPFTNARRMGRRLTRAFGWVGEMFVPKGE
ncbi:hypothetical protein QBC41DRAFT_304643 [Cercophora samala]|uniref:Uncharacterized protein n=1 Tax=Cercophora samala TaxID=330535 RepID=A0AA40DB53_9PEZI|nr:hypothetical protein QBC41DRAFT_304643 [Cercophora samala]